MPFFKTILYLLLILVPQAPKSGRLRILEYAKFLDANARFAIAFEIVLYKIMHSQHLFEELARYYKEIDVAEINRVFLAEANNFGGSVQSISNLLNYGGRVATFYWGVMAKIFNKQQPEFRFVSRGSKSYSWNMNAPDEVNALLNYGYAILDS